MLHRLLLALMPLLLVAADRPTPPGDALLIRGARVFDGTGAAAVAGDVLVEGGRITAMGRHLSRTRGARVVDARGLTLLPGLHDLHTHLRASGYGSPDDLGKAWAAHLANGITSANDFSVSGEMLGPIRAIAADGTTATPRLNLAIRLGVPGGHGTEYGWGSSFTLTATTPRAAHVAMRTALAYRPDVIKVFADGWRYGRSPDLASMNVPTLAAIVEDAHAAGLPVITHTVTLAGAKIAAAAGVDALGHGIGDAPVDAELIALMRARNVAYVPTLVVYEPQQDRTFLPREWQQLAAPERAGEAARMARPVEAIPDLESKRWAILRANVRALHAAGIRIGVGTDAGIGGVYHGSSAVRETRLLARLGLTPAQALVAATGGAADILRQRDHGRIAIGQRADLILVGGRPDVAIDDLHDVRRVFVGGREMPLAALRRRIDDPAPTTMPVHAMLGPIDTGVRGDGRTDLDTLPVESTEPGTDHSRLDIVRPDAPHDPRLFAVARLGAADRPFAALVLPLTKGAIALADARGFTGLAFEARGAGRYVVAFDVHGARSRFRAPFEASGERREIRLPFSAFADGDTPLDLARLRSVSMRLSGEPGGRAWLELAKVRFYR
ncbi:amidohydrolase family protein [Sphingomonas sp. 2R-10]|uniref:amidohydrolase family protein n=1 Tax=Sphingomonas sp. 2R-10 TaxID=3045148 RepID=UPI000F780773|nr:amidohydrolase family protein [Sphingomonas sp. 2R-10]MDJ0278251.1 amidohydrolase family protein [Sphingomonas sp. 2R-10]